jgi:hypothetical protein
MDEGTIDPGGRLKEHATGTSVISEGNPKIPVQRGHIVRYAYQAMHTLSSRCCYPGGRKA